MNVPCSPTPAGPLRSATTALWCRLPTWRKEQPPQLADVWDAAVASLNCATRIAIVGYSIPPTDQHFKFLLAAGLWGNISLRNIFFMNPAARELSKQIVNVLRPDLQPQIVEPVAAYTREVFSNRSYRQKLNREPLPSGSWTS